MGNPTALQVVTIDVERGPCPILYHRRSVPCRQSRVPVSDIDEGLLQSQEIIQWRAATGDRRSYEEADEIVLFQHFVECGLA
jgi:hypothetical protein